MPKSESAWGIIRESGLGADCVSGGEIQASIKSRFSRLARLYMPE